MSCAGASAHHGRSRPPPSTISLTAATCAATPSRCAPRSTSAPRGPSVREIGPACAASMSAPPPVVLGSPGRALRVRAHRSAAISSAAARRHEATSARSARAAGVWNITADEPKGNSAEWPPTSSAATSDAPLSLTAASRSREATTSAASRLGASAADACRAMCLSMTLASSSATLPPHCANASADCSAASAAQASMATSGAASCSERMTPLLSETAASAERCIEAASPASSRCSTEATATRAMAPPGAGEARCCATIQVAHGCRLWAGSLPTSARSDARSPCTSSATGSSPTALAGCADAIKLSKRSHSWGAATRPPQRQPRLAWHALRHATHADAHAWRWRKGATGGGLRPAAAPSSATTSSSRKLAPAPTPPLGEEAFISRRMSPSESSRAVMSAPPPPASSSASAALHTAASARWRSSAPGTPRQERSSRSSSGKRSGVSTR
mmetsp:Transcript_21607/g.66866  ORF Transcript_21607/g.66866 Transcript_21607/m.66866 type:complete len:446 (-) Transcript_21607:204-1541(-)